MFCVGFSPGLRTEEERLTSLLGGSGGGGRSPGIMGAVEPSCEKAIEPLEQDTEGDSGPGLVSLLEGCELDMTERRLIHDALRDCGRPANGSRSFMFSSLGVVQPLPLGACRGCEAGSPTVSLLRGRGRSWLVKRAAAVGAREVWERG